MVHEGLLCIKAVRVLP